MLKKNIRIAIVLITFLALLSTSSLADTPSISKSYNANQTITPGSIVSFNGNYSSVTYANLSNQSSLAGVVVPYGGSLLAINESTSKVQVANSGTVDVLVSDTDGLIVAGDNISISQFNGIGVKSTPGASIIGTAQSAFTDSQQQSESLTDIYGHKSTINVGLVKLNIDIGFNGNNNQYNVNFLQKITKSITGHQISTIRIIISFVIAILTIIFLVTLIYSSVYGTIISVGRNPLAKDEVRRTLSVVLFTTSLTVITSGIIIYFLLT